MAQFIGTVIGQIRVGSEILTHREVMKVAFDGDPAEITAGDIGLYINLYPKGDYDSEEEQSYDFSYYLLNHEGMLIRELTPCAPPDEQHEVVQMMDEGAPDVDLSYRTIMRLRRPEVASPESIPEEKEDFRDKFSTRIPVPVTLDDHDKHRIASMDERPSYGPAQKAS